jgi:hypothetical protein
MSIHVNAKVLINCKRSDVAKVMFNPKMDKLWIRGLKGVYPMSSGLYQMGSKVERVGNFLNRAFSAKLLVTKFVEDSLVEIYADEPFKMKMRYQLNDDVNGTKASISIMSFGEILYNSPVSIISKKLKENIEDDLKRLKDHLELSES